MSAEDAPARPKGYLYVVGAALLWGTIGVFSKRVLEHGVAAVEIAFWRAALAGAAFLVQAVIARTLRLQRPADALGLAAFALIGVSLFYTALNVAIDEGGISLAFVLLYTAPAFVAVLAALLLGERLTPHKSLLVALSIAGVAMVAQGGGQGMTISVASIGWGLVSGLSYASYYLFGKWLLRRYKVVPIYAIVMPLGALGLLPFVRFDAFSAPPIVWLDLGLIALFCTFLAYRLYFTGLRQVEASRAVLVATVEPVVAAVLAAMLFGERLGFWGVIGGLLVLGAAALASLPVRSPKTARPARGEDDAAAL